MYFTKIKTIAKQNTKKLRTKKKSLHDGSYFSLVIREKEKTFLQYENRDAGEFEMQTNNNSISKEQHKNHKMKMK